MKRRVLLLAAVLVAAATAAIVLLRTRVSPPPTPERMEALTRERDALQQKWRDVLAATDLAQAPAGDLAVGLPTSLTTQILAEVVTGVFGRTTLTLQGLRVRKEGEVTAKVLIARRTLGSYLLEAKVNRVQGTLSAAVPSLVFGKDAVSVTAPVRLIGGTGDSDLRFKWTGRGVTGVVCDDFDATRTITGSVVPADYTLAGKFEISADGETLVLSPRFPDLKVRVAVAPSEQAWGVVDALIRDQPRGCEIALGAIDVKERIAGLLGNGFDVRIPQGIFKPIRLPAGVRQSFHVAGMDLDLQVKPKAVTVASDRIWYGADVIVGR